MVSANFLRITGGAVLLSCAYSVHSHHSFAIFDLDNLIERRGIVTKFEFAQPHVLMVLEVERDDGGMEIWEVESMSPRKWDDRGHPRDVAKVGDEITIQGWPARNGTDEIYLSTITKDTITTVILQEVRQRRARENIPEITIKRE